MEQCPRFRAYWENQLTGPVLHMDRADWQAFNVHSTEPTTVDLGLTPLRALCRSPRFLGATANKSTEGDYKIDVYRLDERDYPKKYNKDSYEIVVDINNHLDYSKTVNLSATEDNDNMRAYLRENVFLIKTKRPTDHWLSELPPNVKIPVRTR